MRCQKSWPSATYCNPTGLKSFTARIVFSAWTRFIDGQGPSVKLLAVKSGNGGLGFRGVGHLNKSKSPEFIGHI